MWKKSANSARSSSLTASSCTMRISSTRVLHPETFSFLAEMKFLSTCMQYSAFTRSSASISQEGE